MSPVAKNNWSWPPLVTATSAGEGPKASSSLESKKRSHGSDSPDRPSTTGGSSLLLTLPAPLYWNHVRPFTPPEDRAVVTRECCTRFAPGDKDRRAIDVKDYLRKKWNSDEEYYLVPVLKLSEYRAGGLDASWTEQDADVTRPEKALKLMQATRKQWDEHLAKFDSAADRLAVSLDIVWDDTFGGCCPLLFPGDGGIDAILDYHLKADPRAIGSTKLSIAMDGEVTKTILGHFVLRFLSALRDDCNEETLSCQTDTVGKLLDKLFEHGANTEAFTKPVIELTHKINSFRHFYFTGFWDKSLVENMTTYAKEAMLLPNEPDEELNYDEIERLAIGVRWVAREIGKVEKKAKGEKVKENGKRAWVKVGKRLGYGFP